jgi:hypothetical protein
MNGAELKCELGLLGLSAKWLSERTGTAIRTVIRWIDGDSPLPEWVIAEMVKIRNQTTDMATRVFDSAVQDADGVWVFRTYRTDTEFWRDTLSAEFPADWHRMLTARLVDMHEDQRKARIEFIYGGKGKK